MNADSKAGVAMCDRGRGARAAGRRRGTVLVIILGALALIAVITVVYVTLGQTDRRSAAVTVRRDTTDQVVTSVRDYIAQVIADDAMSVYVDGHLDANGDIRTPVLVRKGATYPFTDGFRRSVVVPRGTQTMVVPYQRFNPTGSYSEVLVNAGVIDPRLPSTPFLASTVPSWLRAGRDTANQPLDQGWRFHRDWMHISNLAPDGRFVNLWNLAPVVGSGAAAQRVSGFDARSWIPVRAAGSGGLSTVWGNEEDQFGPAVVLPDDRVRSWISWGLTLHDPARTGAAINTPLRQRVVENGADQVIRFDPAVQPGAAIYADPNAPAHWTMYQLDAVQPMRDNEFGPDRPEHRAYQWADTDGDGFADARWFEMVDATNPGNIVNLLPRDERFRWFVAARVIDLSGLVNVNTASDLVNASRPDGGSLPEQAAPVGFSPADIDLRRLLALDDVQQQYPLQGGVGLSYANLHQPPASAPQTVENYADQGGVSYSGATAIRVGERGYGVLKLWRDPARVLVPGRNAAIPELTATPPVELFPSSDSRWFNYSRRSEQPSGFYASLATSDQIEAVGTPGLPDLLELLTYRTANDPSATSRLEQLLDGRLTTPVVALRFGPMRSNRSLELELATDILNNATPTDRRPDGLVDDQAWARLAVDVRQHLTTFSGARLLRPAVVAAVQEGALSVETDTKIDAIGALEAALWRRAPGNANAASRVAPDPSLLFQGYADALLPHSGRIAQAPTGQFVSTWSIPYPYADLIGPNYNPAFNTITLAPEVAATATLHYGGNRGPIARWGPELALRMAAHLTANLVDSYDNRANMTVRGTTPTLTLDGDDNTPTAYTLLINASQTQRTFMDGTTPAVLARFPWWSESFGTGANRVFPGRLDLGDPRLAYLGSGLRPNTQVQQDPPGSLATRAGAINVFGIEPQPFLIQVASFCLYRRSSTAEPPAINGTVNAGNDDYLGQILAFQLHNPFDVPVTLNPGVTAAQWPDYYLEYNTRFFKITDAINGPQEPIIMAPGETRVFYTLSMPRATMVADWNGAGASTPPGAIDAIDGFVQAQFNSGNAAVLPPIEIPQVQATGGAPMSPPALPPEGTFNFFADNPATPPETPLGQKQTARLWRALGSLGIDANFGAGSPRPQLIRGANRRCNDLLADSITAPEPPTTEPDRAWLDRTLPSGDNEISGVVTSPNSTLYAFAFHGTMKRRDDPDTGTPRGLAGGVRAYMIEPKAGWDDSGDATNPFNIGRADPTDLPDPSASGPIGDQTGVRADSFSTLYGQLTGAAPTITVDGMRTGARSKNIAGELAIDNLDSRDFDQVRAELINDGRRFYRETRAVPPTPAPSPLPPPPYAARDVQTMRAIDLLKVLAVGPIYDPPAIAGGPTLTLDTPPDPARFITLSQSLALAMNYTSPLDAGQGAGPGPDDADFTIYARLGEFRYAPANPGGQASNSQTPATPRPIAGAVDRGYLVLDRFAPFEDRTVNGVFDGAGNSRDVKRFPGAPLALNILNVFDTRQAGAASLATSIPGLININTASPTVLRTIPLLNPTSLPPIAGLPGTNPNSTSLWAQWLDQALGVGNNSRNVTLSPNTDATAPLLAYRDKQQAMANRIEPLVEIRSAFDQAPLITQAQYQSAVDPRWNEPWLEGPALLPSPAPAWNGRFLTTRSRGVREAPGFASLGEVMLLHQRVDARQSANPYGVGGGAQNPGSRRVPPIDQIDAPAFEGTAQFPTNGTTRLSGTFGTSSADYLVTPIPAPPNPSPLWPEQAPRVPSQVPNSWSERLAAASGVLGVGTTRSDTFAVWFIVHGYQKTDTEELRLTDPLVPTIAKRYVMVVDRSNVTKRGEKPRIVLFSELPLPPVR